MIQEFVDVFMANKEELRESFREDPPDEYISIVRRVVDLIYEKGEEIDKGYRPYPRMIHEIDDCSYEGTKVFVIGSGSLYYYYVYVDYGSCSVCDTLEGIGYNKPATEQQLDDYMTLALHIVQKIKLMP